MLGQKDALNLGVGEKKQYQNTNNNAQNIQALSKKGPEQPIIDVKFGNEIVFTYTSFSKYNGQLFSWLWKDESTFKNYETFQAVNGSIKQSFCQNKAYQINQKFKYSKQGIMQQTNEYKNTQMKLYSQDEISILKKKLEFQHKGLLSKSTDNNSTLGIPVLYRFKCKNNNSTNSCPFLHILEYHREENGKIYYKHKPINSSHTLECTLDDQNIQYNVIMRKIDSSMHILQEIIKQNHLIKPKEILQVFAARTNQPDQEFLYEGLKTKSIRRSIKKYFDNAVAKVKAKLKHP